MIKKLIQFVLSCFLILAVEGNSFIEEELPKKSKWEDFFQNTIDIDEPHETLRLSVNHFEEEKRLPDLAVDLGAGTGRDALYLLANGWKALAIDKEQLAIEILISRAKSAQFYNLEVMTASFSGMTLPDQVLLINASYSLPFCAPEDFPNCWQNIVDHLAIGGRFSGHFMGEKDTWAENPKCTVLTQDQVLELFEEHFVIEHLEIEDAVSPKANGMEKQWHMFHVVAKKIR